MVTLRKAELSDFDSYYTIKCGKSDIYWNGFETPPARDRLYASFIGRLEDRPDQPGCMVLYLICGPSGQVVGYTQFSYNEDGTEFAFSILAEHQGKGYGTQAVAAAVKKTGTGCLYARIREDNAPSRRCFEKNGFVKDPSYFEDHYFPQDKKTFLYERFVRKI